MTTEQLVTLIAKENVRDKLVKRTIKDFPKDAWQAEDWAQRALLYGLRKASVYQDELGALADIMEKGVFIALKDKERQVERRRALNGLPRFSAVKDPMRRVDYKVDLERAVRRTTRDQSLQAALWEVHFEKSTWKEVIDDMPKIKNYEAWEKSLQRANQSLKKEMRRKGYKK